MSDTSFSELHGGASIFKKIHFTFITADTQLNLRACHAKEFHSEIQEKFKTIFR